MRVRMAAPALPGSTPAAPRNPGRVASLPGFRQVIFGLRLALQRRDFVRIDTNHQVADVIVDLGEPVPRARRNDDDVSGLDLVHDGVAYVRTVVPRPVELDDGAQRRGTPLAVDDVGPEDECRRPGDDVVDLADLVVFGDRIRRGLVELAAVDHADADV